MALPDFQTMMLPLLRLAGDDQPHTLAEAVEILTQQYHLSEEDRGQTLRSGQTRLYNRICWATTYLKKTGLLRSVGPGRFEVTDRGHEVLANQPAAIDVTFLESRFPEEMSEFRRSRSAGELADKGQPATFDTDLRAWKQRPGVEQRILETIEVLSPNQTVRHAALKFLASVIEDADGERGDAWLLRQTEHGLRLMAGRLLACELERSSIRVSIIGPLNDSVRSALG